MNAPDSLLKACGNAVRKLAGEKYEVLVILVPKSDPLGGHSDCIRSVPPGMAAKIFRQMADGYDNGQAGAFVVSPIKP